MDSYWLSLPIMQDLHQPGWLFIAAFVTIFIELFIHLFVFIYVYRKIPNISPPVISPPDISPSKFKCKIYPGYKPPGYKPMGLNPGVSILTLNEWNRCWQWWRDTNRNFEENFEEKLMSVLIIQYILFEHQDFLHLNFRSQTQNLRRL